MVYILPLSFWTSVLSDPIFGELSVSLKLVVMPDRHQRRPFGLLTRYRHIVSVRVLKDPGLPPLSEGVFTNVLGRHKEFSV